MKIEILGPGCSRCHALAAVTEAAVAKLGLACEIVKVTDITEIIEQGVMVTPALVIDGTVEVSGKVPSESDVTTILTTALARRQGCARGRGILGCRRGASTRGSSPRRTT